MVLNEMTANALLEFCSHLGDGWTMTITAKDNEAENGPEMLQGKSDHPRLMSVSEHLAAYQRDEEIANTRLGHAVYLLNAHLPVYGFRSLVKPDGSTYDTEETVVTMDDVPPNLRKALEKAMIAATEYAERCFRKGIEDGQEHAKT